MRRLTVCLPSILSLTGLLSAQNILNNSGFETGLMCYGTNVWSNSGVFGKGDYKISLSTDAHSGGYSLQIACPGTDCFKAAVISNKIPTAPNQRYTLNLYVKCPEDATATVYIPDVDTDSASNAMYCNGKWGKNTIEFRTLPTAKDFFFYLFSYGGQWARFDDVVLTYGDRKAPMAATLHPGIRNVGVSDRAVLVDGSPYLALGFFDVDYADLARVSELGANTIFGLGTSQNAACFNTRQEGYLDRAYDLGLGFVPDSSTTARLQIPSLYPRGHAAVCAPSRQYCMDAGG